jgi:hypothetical protein
MKKHLLFFIVLFVSIGNAQVPSYVPSNGLVGYWPFSGNANDASSNVNNGTVNGATLTTDRFGNSNSAYSFDGIDDYIQTQSIFNLVTGTTSRTVSLWLKTVGHVSGRQAIVMWGTQVGCYGKFNVNVARSYGSFISLITGCGNYDNPASVLDNNWHNIICVFDSSLGLNTATARYYLDGVSLNNTGGGSNLTANIFTQPSPIDFGRDGNSGYMIGLLDDVAIWSRVLTQSEITGLYTTLGTEQIPANNQIKVYPNPAKEQITIDLGTNSNIIGGNYKIINTLGQEVLIGVLNSQQNIIQLNNIKGQGVYFVKIYDNFNNLLETKKIIIQE